MFPLAANKAVGGEFRVMESRQEVIRGSQAIRLDDGVIAEQPPGQQGQATAENASMGNSQVGALGDLALPSIKQRDQHF